MISFWERDSLLDYDIIVVGAGIVGLSTAATLKESCPELNILVLERGILPSGASTKNAGFACFGSPTELLADLKVTSEADTVKLVRQRCAGLRELRRRLGDDGIGLVEEGGYEVISEKEEYCLEQLPYLNALLEPVFHAEVFSLCGADVLKSFGFGPAVKHLVRNNFEAQIDTGKMMQNVLRYVAKLGVDIRTGCEVVNIDDKGDCVHISVAGLPDATFSAKRVGICTNAFSGSLFEDLPCGGVSPGRGLVLATGPIEGLPFRGVFHLDEGFFYFRNHGNRVIFGGGRNLDKDTEETIWGESYDFIDIERKTAQNCVASDRPGCCRGHGRLVWHYGIR